MRSRQIALISALVAVALIVAIFLIQRNSGTPAPEASPLISATPLPGASTSPSPAPSGPTPSPSPSVSASISGSVSASGSASAPPTSAAIDLTADANGLSKSTAVMTTTEGVVKFKFYPKDAPNTVNRFIELIQKGFYNGLNFHRVVPGFVVQGGDPLGNGTGGSGQKMKAEFNNRRHVEGAVAMARAADPDSADSQFYIALGALPHLDHQYTVFGQVIEGMDAVRKIKIGDKITSVVLQ